MTDKSDGGPAFPMIGWKSPDGMLAMPNEPGMSLRDWFAGQAMKGLIAHPSSEGSVTIVAQWAYDYADAMLAVRKAAQ